MRKQLFNALFCCLLVMPIGRLMADVVDEGQSTEGKDFWVTFMQADQDPNNTLVLSLSISSRENCQVTIANPFTGYSENVNVTAGQMQLVELYSGNVLVNNARTAMATTGKVCYAVNSEQVDTCALHVTATANISLFATNYKKATFDATNVLPTASLLDEYIIQTYTPSDHGGPTSTQGSHFAVIAVEDNTVIDYCPTEETTGIQTLKNTYDMYIQLTEEQREQFGYIITPEMEAAAAWKVGDTLHSPVMKQGEVWYVWTGKKDGEVGDLSGTYVKARDGKKIAVFQGCPHTNIPYQKKQRDHIFSQAMPTQYWGNTFVLTASAGRVCDAIRILALHDDTEIYVNGILAHTIHFASDKKHYWEFEIGTQGDYGTNGSCVVTTSCPCAVHLFIVSQQYKDSENKSGDPAMLWINPIEQQIDQVTFATYASSNSGTTYHHSNVVTDQPSLMYLDGNSIADQFQAVSGSNTYYFARLDLGTTASSHTLKSNGSNFIAHVYGFTNNESYGYSAGGATKPLSQSIYINGEEFSPDKENKLCGKDTVKFACKPDFVPDSITWHFGDGTPDITLIEDTATIVPHYYQNGGVYDASCIIYRNSSNVCVGQSATTTINIKVTIGRYSFTIEDPIIPCPEGDIQPPGIIPYTSSINLKGDDVTVDFDEAAKADEFTKDDIIIRDNYFELIIPDSARINVPYGIHIQIHSTCGDKDTTLIFRLPVNNVIEQRYNSVLGLTNDSIYAGQTLSDFQWYRTSDSTALLGQVSAVLNMYDIPNEDFKNDAFYVCYTINKGMADEGRSCACAKAFNVDSTKYHFEPDPDLLTITAIYSYMHNGKIFVNADYKGKTDIECYAQWITSSGKVYKDMKFTIPDGGCTIDAPAEPGLYLLRVVTDGDTRSFKFVIQ